jgi:hypothetical protein
MRINDVSKYIFSREPLPLVIGSIFFLCACLLNSKNEKPLLILNKQDSAININKDLLVFTSFGNKRILTDLIWVQTLLESDMEHYRKKDLNNWLFLRFNTVSVLDPYFYENYFYGGQFLGIVKDDLYGASKIYDKGLEVYPDDYKLNYNAGFLNYYELDNYEKGLKYLLKIKNNPKAPVFIQSIINKLNVSTGINLEEVFKFVLHQYENTKDEYLLRKLKNDLYAIKAQIDLKCLNNNQTNCETKDLEGNSYILRADGYHTLKKFRPYRISSRKGKINEETDYLK